MWITDRYLDGKGNYSPVHVINNTFYNWDHRFIYDRVTLAEALSGAGFVDIAQQTSGESPDGNLANLERHGKVISNEEINRFETLVLEARRPGS